MLFRAKRAVEEAPLLVPVLHDAGVVDAGGQGLYYFFEGMSRVIGGDGVSDRVTEATAGAAVVGGEQEYGYEVQLLIEGEQMDLDT